MIKDNIYLWLDQNKLASFSNLILQSLSVCLLLSSSELSYAHNSVFFLNQNIISNVKGQNYLLQIGSFKSKSNALKFQSRIQRLIHYPVYIRHTTYYKVIVGPLATLKQTKQVAQDLLTKIQPKDHPAKQIFSVPPQPITIIKATPYDNRHWFGTIGGGAQWSQSNSSMTVPNGSQFSSPQNVDLFSIQNHDTGGLFFLSAGRRWERDSDWFSAYSLGIYYQYLVNHSLNGTITQYSEQEFLNYSYQWSSASNVILLSGKVNVYQVKKWSPYVSLGLGTAINQTRDYSESAFSGIANRDSPAYTSGTSTNFAYQAGVGLDYQMTTAWTLGLGYLYQNVGTIASGAGKSTWSSTHLSLGSLAQNELTASVTYLF